MFRATRLNKLNYFIRCTTLYSRDLRPFALLQMRMLNYFMQIKLWGLRGSIPSPLAPTTVQNQTESLLLEAAERKLSTPAQVNAFLSEQPTWRHGGYGGNTSCFEVISKEQYVFIDAGSGLRAFGHELALSGADTRAKDFHIFFTHFHWDHLLGLCFFMPIFLKGHRIHFYAVQPELEHVIRTLFTKPFFPVAYEKLGATLIYHKLEPRKPFVVGDIELTPYRLDHPDPCWGYKIRVGEKNFAVCVDTECLRVTPKELGPDLPLYQGLDAMLFDAQYTLTQAVERITWGHAAAVIGLDLAMREAIKKVYFVHHDPSFTDREVYEAESQTRDYYNAQLKSERRANRSVHEVEWTFAHEGMVIRL